MDGEANPYWVQAKHVLGAFGLFVVVIVVAIAVDRANVWLVSIGWIKQNGLHYWALEAAEILLFLTDTAALVITVFVTTIRFVIGLLRPKG